MQNKKHREERIHSQRLDALDPEQSSPFRIHSRKPLISPRVLMNLLPLSASAKNTVDAARSEIIGILENKDPRLLVILGPCSIHDTEAALDYAELVKSARNRFTDELCIIMRVYFEKPRTTMGWKGLISDPSLDGSFDMNLGLKLARKLLLNLAELGVPAGTEFLDTAVPHYLADLISWGAIGARTVESQIHRELASALPMPVGFKNNTDGNVKTAIDAVNVARHGHHLITVTEDGTLAALRTQGNPLGHVVLRGGNSVQNYTAPFIQETASLLQESRLNPRLIIDCSHGNSLKDYRRQRIVLDAIAEQIQKKSPWISGVMLESNLVEGKQEPNSPHPLVYGKSITDGCIGWKDTLPLLKKLAAAVRSNF